MVRVGINKGYTGQSIIDAAEKLYDEMQNGLCVDPIRLAWEVYHRANIERVIINPATLGSIYDEMMALKNEITELKKVSVPWYMKLWRKAHG